jgi:hypothetical protein
MFIKKAGSARGRFFYTDATDGIDRISGSVIHYIILGML